MKSVLISEFKTHCVGLLHEVQDSREELLVTKQGQPVAVIHPAKSISNHERLPDDCQDCATIHGNIIETNMTQDWESM